MRNINVFLGRGGGGGGGGGGGETFYVPDGENLSGRPQSDQKMMESVMACINFFFPVEIM